MRKNIKIIILVFAIAISFFTFSSCNATDCDGCEGNKTTFDFTKTYEHALIKVKDEWITVNVKQWNDYEGEQIQLLLEDDTVLLINSNQCILYSGTLPDVE